MNTDSAAAWTRSVLLSATLSIIAEEGPTHGYRIVRSMEERGLRRPSHGALYPILRAAEAEGLIESTWEQGEKNPNRMVCRLTPAGARRLLAEREEWDTFTRRMDRLLEAGTNALDLVGER